VPFFFFFYEFNVAVRYYAVLEKSRLKTRLASVAVSGTEQCKRSSHWNDEISWNYLSTQNNVSLLLNVWKQLRNCSI